MRTYKELLAADDSELNDALGYADVMALRGLLYQLTGDETLRRAALEVRPMGAVEATFLADAADEDYVRRAGLAYLQQLRDAGIPQIPIGPESRLATSLELTAGQPVKPDEMELWLEELALDPWCRSLTWTQPPDPAKLREFSVLVIGAGLGGINAAIQLKRAGIPFRVLEKNPAIGGTWYENRYPGARVDTPNRSYSYVLAVDYPHSGPYCTQAENETYLNWAADEFGIREHIQLQTEVRSLAWDDQSGTWAVAAHGPTGEQVLHANAVICAVGFLSRPNVPDLPGADHFTGPRFHSAQWPEGLDAAGKRVAIIGSGCTGYQLGAELAGRAAHLFMFQRTPQWLFDRQGYLSPYPPQVLWLCRNLPYYNNFLRFRASWNSGPYVQSLQFNRDPDWPDPLTMSARNQRRREERLRFLAAKLGHWPDLLAKMIPPHPPLSARPVAVDKDYSIADAILREDVTLVTEPIKEVTATGILTNDGTLHDFDILVYATGFKANDFLGPMDIRGRGGVRVRDLWSRDGARAWIGTMLPGCPNFFMLYGPNTNPFSLGVVTYSELMTRFALQRMDDLITGGRRSVEVTQEAYERYNADLDAREKQRAWSHERANTYFRNASGRSATNFPFEGTDLWRWLRDPDPAALVIR